MTPFAKKTLYFSLILSFILLISGCGVPVRHINSDVCLIKHGNSPKEVMDILGPPNIKTQETNGELWTYYAKELSPLKRTPVMRLMFGSISYDVVHVTFTNNLVSNCQYRHATEAEFKHSKIGEKHFEGEEQ